MTEEHKPFESWGVEREQLPSEKDRLEQEQKEVEARRLSLAFGCTATTAVSCSPHRADIVGKW